MWDDYKIFRVRVLLAFLKGTEDDHTVVKIAKTLNVTKQRVSRLLMELEKDGIIDRANPRNPQLTPQGRSVANRYAERITVSINHLLFEGVSLQKAEQDAYHWAIYNTDETMEVIKNSATWYRVKYELRDRRNFSGDVLCKTLGDGDYHFNYVIYREHAKDGSNVSMANQAFAHPGSLVVKNGVGMLYLRILNLTAKSPFTMQEITGKVSGCQYMVGGEFIPAEMNEDIVAFPASALNFVNIGANMNQILHGSVCLKMTCSVSMTHTPQVVAIFTMLL